MIANPVINGPIKVTPWSYTSLNDFETCPRRFYLTRVAKVVKEGQSEAMAEGNRVHKALELFVKDGIPLPETYKKYHAMAAKITATPGTKIAEFSFGLNRELKPTTFFAKDVWVRGKLDLTVLRPRSAIVIDYKTGKRKEDIHQLRLFAGVAFRSFPAIERVATGYAWLPDNKLDTESFTRDDDPLIWQGFAIRVHRMEEAGRTNQFPPRPSGLCRKHCPVGRTYCEHCGE